MGKTVQLKNVVITFPHLYEPHAATPTATPKYSAGFLLEPVGQNAEAMKVAMLAELRDKGKEQFAAQIHPPWKTGEEINASRATKAKAPREEVAGKWEVNAKDGKYQPVVMAQDGRTPITVEQGANIFGGCVVNAVIDVFWSPNSQNPGLFCGLRAVQLVDNVNVQHLGGGREEVTFEAVGPAQLTPAVNQPGPMPTGPAATPDWM